MSASRFISPFTRTRQDAAAATVAGAAVVGAEDLVKAIQGGELNFDRCIATPEVMPLVSRVARVLGPRGLMPNPKMGTVTKDVATAVKVSKEEWMDGGVDGEHWAWKQWAMVWSTAIVPLSSFHSSLLPPHAVGHGGTGAVQGGPLRDGARRGGQGRLPHQRAPRERPGPHGTSSLPSRCMHECMAGCKAKRSFSRHSLAVLVARFTDSPVTLLGCRLRGSRRWR